MRLLSLRGPVGWFFVFALVSVPRSAFASGQTGINNGLAVSVGGVSADAVANWEGGDPRTTYPANIAGGRIEYAPLLLDFPLIPAAPIQSWLSDFARLGNQTRSLTLSEFVNDQVVETITIPSASIFEVRVAGLDTLAAVAPHVVLSIQPAAPSRSVTQQKLAPAPLASVTGRGSPQANSFRFTVSGLSGSTPLVRIDDIVLKNRAAGSGSTSAGSSSVPLPGTLVLTMRSADGAAWRAWRDSAMDYTTTNGHGPVPDVRTATLEFLLGSGTASPFKLQFTQVLLMRFSHLNSAEQLSQVELAYKSVTFTTDASAAGTTTTNPSPSPASSNPTRVDPQVTLPPTAVPTRAPGSSGDPSPIAPVGAPTPSTPRTVGVTPNVGPKIATPLTAQMTPDADKGARDPREFPRPAGLARTTYSSSNTTANSVQLRIENAGYTSALSFDGLVQAYHDAAESGGWHLVSNSESGDVSTRRIMMMVWAKDGTNTDLRVYSTKGAGSESFLSVVSKD